MSQRVSSMVCSVLMAFAILITPAAWAEGNIRFDLDKQWASGFKGTVTIDNTGGDTLQGWQVRAKYNGDVSQIWQASIVSSDDGMLVIEPASYNRQIKAGQSVTFGLVGRLQGGASLPEQFTLVTDDRQQVPASPVIPVVQPETEPDAAPVAPPSPEPVTPVVADPSSQGVVSRHGQLSVRGTQIVDQSGTAIQLKGMSSHGLQWFGQFMNDRSIGWLRDDWQATIVRAAMYTDPKADGYIANRQLKKKVYEIVDAAIELDLYVIVDWHILKDNDPNQYRSEAIQFFDEVSARYAGVPNLIYEIANEPNPNGPGKNVTWDASIKPYAQAVVPVIRRNDPQSVVLVGTSTWSQDVDDAANDPLSFSNVAYTLHFYACTHGQALRDKAAEAMSQGAALFVSEWGTTSADGNGAVCESQSRQWIRFLDKHAISWVNWSLADKNEASAALNPGAAVTGGWSNEMLSPSGLLVREFMRQ